MKMKHEINTDAAAGAAASAAAPGFTTLYTVVNPHLGLLKGPLPPRPQLEITKLRPRPKGNKP